MKRFPWLLGLCMASASCQPHTSTTQAGVVAPSATVAQPSPESEHPLPALFTAADTLTGPMRKLLQQHDLAKLWQSDMASRRTNPTLEGFFGPDHYHFGLVFNEVARDSRNPAVYHVRGKCRYRKNIRPFEGTLTVRQITDLDAPYDYDDFGAGDTAIEAESMSADTLEARYARARRQSHPYTLRAQLQLAEKNEENSGLFEGEAILNFHITTGGRMDYVTAPMPDENAPARGSAMLIRGARRNVSTRQVKQFVVADDVFAAAPDVYKDFGVGDRSGEVNPKYAKLGWNEAWENDEWWADSPQPSLNL